MSAAMLAAGTYLRLAPEFALLSMAGDGTAAVGTAAVGMAGKAMASVGAAAAAALHA
jgi:hypothetical protein